MPVVTSTGAAATKVMTIAAFGTSIMNKETKMNLGVIQYKGTGPKGEAYYYDENILDVKPKYASGKFMELSAGEWAHVFVTIDADNNGVFYVNAQPVQTFTTASRPDKTGSGLFTVGMGYGDNYVPKEFNLGMRSTVNYESTTKRKRTPLPPPPPTLQPPVGQATVDSEEEAGEEQQGAMRKLMATANLHRAAVATAPTAAAGSGPPV
ncbi:hypothetical protein RI054_22g97960 [Pseudoscourfieldia marina]